MIRRRRARVDHEAAIRVEHTIRHARWAGHRVVRVASVYHRAGRGTKAFIELYGDGWQGDSWFWWSRVSPGQWLVVDGSAGWGRHHERWVLYVGNETGWTGIHHVLPAGDVKRWMRHQRRHPPAPAFPPPLTP